MPPESGRNQTGVRQDLAVGPTGTGRLCAYNSWNFFSLFVHLRLSFCSARYRSVILFFLPFYCEISKCWHLSVSPAAAAVY